MMKLRYLFENYSLAKAALQNWRHDENRLDEALSWFRISSNAVYPFFRDGALCFLRIAPTTEKRRENVSGELEFISYLRERNFPALAPIPSKDGRLLVEYSCEGIDYFVSVFEKVPGVQLDETSLGEEILREAGRTLGELHRLSSGFHPQIRKWSHEEALDWAEQELAAHSAPASALREAAALRKELAALPRTAKNYGLIHYDFEPDNVFYDEQSGRCSVIDFDDGMYHWFALDVEQCFDALRQDTELKGGALLRARETFQKGYETVFSFPDEALFPLMRRYVNLFGYARVLRAVDECFPSEPDWMTELREKLRLRQREIEASF